MNNTIVVADEDSAVRNEIKDCLEQEGFQVIEAPDGDTALDYALEFQPCLLIAEADMPLLDGWNLCLQKRNYEELRGVPILLMGDFQEKKNRTRAVEWEADDYMNKPLEKEDVVARVQLLLKRFREKKQPVKYPKISLRGEISLMPPGDLMQHLLNTRKSGILSLYSKLSTNGHVYFRDGEIIHARLENSDSIKGRRALLRILTWAEGSFAFEEQDPVCQQTLHGNTFGMLMECLRLRDELEALQEKLPSLDQPLYINFSKDFFKWGLLHATPEQIKILNLLHRRGTVREVMDSADVDDVVVVEKTIEFFEKGILTS